MTSNLARATIVFVIAALGVLPFGGLPGTGLARASAPTIEFDMSVSAGAAACLPNATAHVKVQSAGSIERMDVKVSGLPANTQFGLFVIQVPKAPFGVSWYQGDIQTNRHGSGSGKFAGRFSIETFVVATGSAPAPIVNDGPFPDASLNPPFNPIHTYHLGLWFKSPADAGAAGCPSTVTPFNGDHTAGIQVLNTATGFADDHGPLRQLAP